MKIYQGSNKPTTTSKTCYFCEKPIIRLPREEARKNGRPWKHSFCDINCYNKWRSKEHLRAKAEWLLFQRETWGSTEAKRHDVNKAKQIGRYFELIAKDLLLPRLGFSEIDDLSGLSNQFFVDFIATYQKERVLVDATIKLKAYIPKKIHLARSLRMKLFIIFLSPRSPETLYWLGQVPERNQSVIRVPACVFKERP